MLRCVVSTCTASSAARSGDVEVMKYLLDHGAPLADINELEYIKGQIFANVWKTDRIVRIDPASGQVLGDIDLSGLLSEQDRAGNIDVLNGIAYDPAGDRIFVTGKYWPKLFEIKITKP